MKKYFDILRKCRLFSGVEDENLIPLLGCIGAKVESYGKKYTVLAEGSAPKYMGIVLSGSVQVINVDYYGNRTILSGAEPSELFGEAFACAEIKSLPVSVIANEDSEIMLISAERILHSCHNACAFHQKMIFNLMKNLADKNIMFHKKVEITSKRTTREKLMTYLMLEAKKQGKNEFLIPFDRQELSDYLEVERSGLSAEISKLRNEGIIECRKNRFKLL
ncbi:MAG: Crp/Fnr family transcriptional regulator [Clostridia bacterium]|nr:Crp/Fnr family transcriptional regulator [Clostridia bacterium]